MKVLLIHNYYQYRGGEETYVQNITKLLRAYGHRVILYSKDSKRIKKRDKFLIALRLFWNSTTISEIADIVQKHHPNVAFVQNIYPLMGPTVYWALKRFNVPIIQRISNYRLVCPKTNLFRKGKICELCVGKKLFLPSIFFGCYNSSHIASLFFTLSFYFHMYIIKSFLHIGAYIFPSEFIKKYVTKSSIVPESKARVIQTFAFPTATRINTQIATKKRYFLYAGRLSEEKGILALINLFKSKQLEDLRLVILGDGPLKSAVISAIKDIPNISYKGNVAKDIVMSYLRDSHALVIPSLWFDVLPNIVLESFSVGTPVVAPNLGTFSTLITNGKNGYTYSHIEELKRILSEIASNRILLNKHEIIDASHDYLTPSLHYKQLMKTIYEICKTS